MRSLKTQLGLSLFIVSIAVGLLAAAISFKMAHAEAWRFFDQQLRIIAHNLESGGANPTPLPEAEASSHDPEDDFVVQIWDVSGWLLRQWPTGPILPKGTIGGFRDVVAPDGKWRCYMVIAADHAIQVSQRFEVRDELAREAAYRSLVPILATIPIAWLILGLIINRVFGRLDTLARNLTGRSVSDGSSIPLANVPKEVRPFVAGVNDALARMQETLQSQRRFVADAAHALRTPLAVLQTQIENIRHVVKDQEGARRIEELDRGIQRATLLVRQLLRMARSQAEREIRHVESVDLVAVTTASIADLLPLADLRRHDIGLAHSDPARITTDPDDARTLVDNIVENAIRYTPDGGVIDIAIAVGEDGTTFEVRDTGLGIPEPQIDRVLEPFYRAADADTEGSGLGLSIVAAIVERCGARLSLQNRVDRSGLVVSVVFPHRQGVAEE